MCSQWCPCNINYEDKWRSHIGWKYCPPNDPGCKTEDMIGRVARWEDLDPYQKLALTNDIYNSKTYKEWNWNAPVVPLVFL